MNHLSISILLFIIVYLGIVSIKPNFIYNTDGSLRPFGLGYRKKTVTPLWLIVFILAIFSYHAGNYLHFKYLQ
jgi:hypothetical protein